MAALRNRWPLLGLLLILGRNGFVSADSSPDFDRDVRPILSTCVSCHSGAKPKGGLDLTSRSAALKGGEAGTSLVEGKADESPLYERVASGEMPPKKALPKEQAETLKRWIDSGAKWSGIIQPVASKDDDRWAWKPLKKTEPPKVKDSRWVRDPIDAYILATLEAKNLKPSPEADRRTLIRRLTLDLHGLPPTPEAVEAFVNDASPNAYERLIDRLLSQPEYGERWARHWLDATRYTESHGFEYDRLRDHAWRYRDAVISSLNRDVPYTRFVQEQVAGDVLEPVTRESIALSGFLVNGPWDEAGNAQKSEAMKKRVREDELEDMVGAVAQTFLGVTVNCARCHDHKFDPIPQRDYYRLKAAFEGVRHGNRPALSEPERLAREAEIRDLESKIADAEKVVAGLDRKARDRLEKREPAKGLPVALRAWSFEDGEPGGSLIGKAKIVNGRLVLDGKTSYLMAPPLGKDLKAKTLEAWVALGNLKQQGAGVISLISNDGRYFDSIVFGERVPRRWMFGSDFFVRTKDVGTEDETASSSTLVHVAIATDQDGKVNLYRNGVPYGSYQIDRKAFRAWNASDTRVLIGLRHPDAGNGYLAGEVEEARIYDRALTPEEVAASFQAGFDRIPLADLMAKMTPEERASRKARDKELTTLRARRKEFGSLDQTYAPVVSNPPPTHVLSRGDIDRKGELVSAGGLSAVEGYSPDIEVTPEAPEAQRRRNLAKWLTDPKNPLWARVIVNRIWQGHFGIGLVATPNDFGVNGERPSHPELLDRLAADFVAGGSHLKALHRRIVLSSTYRQASTYNEAAAKVDSENRLLWRFAPRRLEGEAIRDGMLAVSGALNPKRGGPSFRPFAIVTFNSSFYNPIDSADPELNRRTIYRMNVSSARHPLLETLDCPDPSLKTPRRAVTTTPLQALTLMNDAFVLRMAKTFADRVAKEGQTDEQKVERAFRLALNRPPTAEERTESLALLKSSGPETLGWTLLNTAEFLYIP